MLPHLGDEPIAVPVDRDDTTGDRDVRGCTAALPREGVGGVFDRPLDRRSAPRGVLEVEDGNLYVAVVDADELLDRVARIET